MPKKISELGVTDMPNTAMVPDGYDMKRIPTPTTENILLLIAKINELVIEVNELKALHE